MLKATRPNIEKDLQSIETPFQQLCKLHIKPLLTGTKQIRGLSLRHPCTNTPSSPIRRLLRRSRLREMGLCRVVNRSILAEGCTVARRRSTNPTTWNSKFGDVPQPTRSSLPRADPILASILRSTPPHAQEKAHLLLSWVTLARNRMSRGPGQVRVYRDPPFRHCISKSLS